MTQKLIVATFGNLDVAQRASRDLHNFEKDDDFKIESGVMVEKTSDGKLHVLTQYSEPHWGVVIGAVSGALIGLLGGPPGAIAGAVAGAGAGLAGRALEHVLDKKLTGAIELELRPGPSRSFSKPGIHLTMKWRTSCAVMAAKSSHNLYRGKALRCSLIRTRHSFTIQGKGRPI
ncbi:hypothetical protein [Paraburkholderia sp. BR10882]|uniref:hypothetical protein n=1 Tax=unclassified Paraburkholderia TaxID=2615204 RepID=UPI0034CEEB0C